MQPEFGTSEDLPGTDHGALTDNTAAGIARWRAYEDKVLAQLQAIPAECTSRRIRPRARRSAARRSRAQRGCASVSPRVVGVASYVNGWQASLTDLARVQPVGSDVLRRIRTAARQGHPTFHRQRDRPAAAGTARGLFIAKSHRARSDQAAR